MPGALFLALVLLSSSFLMSSIGSAQEQSTRQLVSEAVTPLPPGLREGATVVRYTESGEREVLRDGTNGLICRANPAAPPFVVHCYHRELAKFVSRVNQLNAQGKSPGEVRDQVSAEIRGGRLPAHPAGVAEYFLTGPDAPRSIPIMVVFVPGATSESTGLSSEPDNYRPWLMWAGTPGAHIMMPGQ